ncbi:unnamed protein product [Rhizophagus irregularis]|uniref:Uncharacterized protein n=1 Tax=Rhizophagus irregularis TaxID=588596 RepID=A0A2N1MBZ3_9GLOM|nr:hypothetical protein RhiirC2_795256 [Rhizophagus irregularis]CAB5377588.1 unnamed protein product [Rhizophagus irregularis]
MDQVYTNRNLKDAIEHYRNNFLHFSIPLTNSCILHSYHVADRHAEVKRAVVNDSEEDDETDSEEDESDEVDESRIQ